MTDSPTFRVMDPSHEVELLTAARSGDMDAYLQLARRYLRPVLLLCYSMTRNADDAATLACDTFTRGWTGIQDLPGSRGFHPWLLRIARNLSVAHARRRAGESSAATTAATTEDDARKRALEEALGRLRPDEQMMLALRNLDGLSYTDIASVLDLSNGVTILRLSQARAFLLSAGKEPSAGPS